MWKWQPHGNKPLTTIWQQITALTRQWCHPEWRYRILRILQQPAVKLSSWGQCCVNCRFVRPFFRARCWPALCWSNLPLYRRTRFSFISWRGLMRALESQAERSACNAMHCNGKDIEFTQICLKANSAESKSAVRPLAVIKCCLNRARWFVTTPFFSMNKLEGIGLLTDEVRYGQNAIYGNKGTRLRGVACCSKREVREMSWVG